MFEPLDELGAHLRLVHGACRKGEFQRRTEDHFLTF